MSKVCFGYNEYYDKVYGCWLGKNAGGTLGAPLEAPFGKEELFDVRWYTRIEEGGIPNDDLEIQLIWLQALEDEGLNVTSRELAEYWLDCIKYNFDEYGLGKANLKKGLLPPISGYYNNWFKDCMGSPIRSEIWACIAPGVPEIATLYAYEDAIVDHAGGESVFGEMFNAALESAAFVVNDKIKLIEIALSFIPENSKIYNTVKDVVDAYKRGISWKEARSIIYKKYYSPIAQYSPINIGFQTIGLLYGEDFGDAICKTVNCGYDTDCTGATVGAILGIILGKNRLPEKWIAPLGNQIATNATWGGIANVKLPESLHELTERVCQIGYKVISSMGRDKEAFCNKEIINLDLTLSLSRSEKVEEKWAIFPTITNFNLGTIEVTVDYRDEPVIRRNSPKTIGIEVFNKRLEEIKMNVFMVLQEGWEASPIKQKVILASRSKTSFDFTITVESGQLIRNSNKISLSFDIDERPFIEDIPIVLLAPKKWLFYNKVFTEYKDVDTPTPLEDNPNPSYISPDWRETEFTTHELEIESIFEGKSGILYLRHYIYNPCRRGVRVGFPSNCPFKMWLNGTLVHKVKEKGILRPSYIGDFSSLEEATPGYFPTGRSYKDVVLEEGWNQFFIKVLRLDNPAEAHFVISSGEPFYDGLVDLEEHLFPWEI